MADPDERLSKDDHDPDEDDVDDPWEECRMLPDGQCLLAGSEWCDWDCPRNKR